MKRKHLASEVADNLTWSITRSDPAFPQRLALHPRGTDWQTLYGVGHKNILQRKCLGLICSIQCPGSVVMKTFDAIRELRDAGVVVAGGFHSPMEQECLDFLFRGDQPIIICPARHPGGIRIPEAWRAALAAGRLLLVSPFDSGVRRTTQARAQSRNEFVSALSAAVLIPHASPDGSAEATAQRALHRAQTVFVLGVEENQSLLGRGASKYDLAAVQNQVAPSRA